MDVLLILSLRVGMVYGDASVEGYDHVNAREWVRSLKDMPVADPAKVALGVRALVAMEDPPTRAFIGKSVLEAARQKLKEEQELLSRVDVIELAESVDA